MKFALIIQPLYGCESLLSTYNLGYHMALAQYVLSDERYAAIYKKLHAQGHFIMLDNGAAENGHSIGIENVVAAAEMIGADEIVMPDVLDECRATMMVTLPSLQYVPMHKRAVVPQGKDWTDWENCAFELVEMHCHTICVAKRYEDLPGGRAHALQLIESHGWHKTHNIHLLGCRRRPLIEISEALRVAPWVRGIDTAAPIGYAQNGALIEASHWFSFQWNVPLQYAVAEHNIEEVLDACNR